MTWCRRNRPGLLLQLGRGEVQLAPGDNELLDLLGALEDVQDLSLGAGRGFTAGQTCGPSRHGRPYRCGRRSGAGYLRDGRHGRAPTGWCQWGPCGERQGGCAGHRSGVPAALNPRDHRSGRAGRGGVMNATKNLYYYGLRSTPHGVVYISDREGKPLPRKDTMTDITATIQTKIADELATALLSSARALVYTAQAEAAEDAGDDTAAADHEERMLSENTAASEARRRAELIIETAQACGVHIGDAVRIAAETEALDQPAGAGKTIRQAIAELEDQARTIRRGK